MFIFFYFYSWQCGKTKKLFPKAGEEILCEELPLMHSNEEKQITPSLAVVMKMLVEEENAETFPWKNFCSFHEMWPETGNNEWKGSHGTPAFEQIILGLNWGGDLDYQGPEYCHHQ